MKTKRKLIQICLLCAALTPAFAQNNTFKLATTLQGAGAANPAQVIAADLNGDGQVDLIGAGTIFTNNGNGIFGALPFNPQNIRSNGLVVADVNHDGRLDLIALTNLTTSPYTESIVVYTNAGNHSSYPQGFMLGFHSSTTNVGGEIASGSGALGSAGDVFGNGRANLFYFNAASNSVSLFTNDGSGIFGSNTTFGVRMGLPAVADVNRDGKTDFISLGYTNDLVYVFTNNGGGVFGSNAAFSVPAPTAVFTADVNADGWVDLLVLSVTNYIHADNLPVSTLSIWTNNGSGVFGSNVSFTVGSIGQRVNDLKAATLFGDGRIQLAFAVNDVYLNTTYLMVYTNNGAGGFGSNFITANLSAAGLVNPVSLAVADERGDGQLDLISANYGSGGSGTITVFTNCGSGIQSGSFLSNSCPAVGTNAYFVLAADLYRQGQPQLVTYTTSYAQNLGFSPALLVLTNNGSGRFGSNAVVSGFGGVNSYITAAPIAADIFGNGYPALMVCMENYGFPRDSIVILTNNGSGVFGTNSLFSLDSSLYNAETADVIVAADVNGDGKLDLVVGCGNGFNSGLLVLTNNGAGGFGLNVRLNIVGTGLPLLAVADINADGRPDLITASSAYIDGGFTSLLTVFTNLSATGAGPLYSTPNFAYSDTYPITPGANPSAIVVADVNGDGNPDVIIANNNDPGTLSVMLNNGDNNGYHSYSFALASSPVVGAYPQALTAADVNGDGKIDLISANWGPVTNASDARGPLGYGTLSVLTNNGSGGFTHPATFSTDPGPNAVIALDVNQDGKPDLITANFTAFTNNRYVDGGLFYGDGHTLSILLNTSNFVNTVALQTAPSDAPITYGQTFLTGGAVTNEAGVAVNGTFAFANGAPPAGTANYPVTFAATPPTDYQPITFNVSITVSQLVAFLNGLRAYDGTTNVVSGVLSLANKVGNDDVTVSAGSAGLDTANVGTNPITSTTGLVLGGATAGNYTLAGVGGAVVITQAVNLPGLTASLNPSGYHAGVSFTATLPAYATGTIQFLTNDFLFDTEALTSGSAGSLTDASLPPGVNSIAAVYSGDANNSATTSYLEQLVLAPQFNTIVSGTGGLIMSGSWGAPNATFYLLTSTNLNLPISQWTPVLTNQFDNNGNYNLTNPMSAAPEVYYILEQP